MLTIGGAWSVLEPSLSLSPWYPFAVTINNDVFIHGKDLF